MERYARYKNSGIDWIGEIPEGWEINRNKHLNSLFGRIGWQGLSSDEYIDEGPKLITGVNFSKGRIDWDGCVSISEERWGEAEQIQIKEDDLLITKDGTVGKVAMATNCPEKASLNSGVLLIRPTTNKACKRYLFWMLQSNVFWGWFSNTNAGNSTIIHLYQSSFADMPLLLPSIEEQATIAAFLDTKTKEIDLAVEAAEKSIILLHEYRQSIITEAVTQGLDPYVPMKPSGIEWMDNIPASWQARRVKAVVQRLNVGVVIEPSKYFDDNGTVPFLRGVNIKADGFDLSDLRYITTQSNALLKKSIVHTGDIVVVRDGAPGTALVIPPQLDGANCVSLLELTCASNIKPTYLRYALAANCSQAQFAFLSNGTAIKHLNASELGMILVTVPPLSKQDEIIAYLDAKTAEIDALIASKERQVELLREYRKSIISEAVTGKFKVPGLE